MKHRPLPALHRSSLAALALAAALAVAGAGLLFTQGGPAGDPCANPRLTAAEAAAHRGITLELAGQLGAARSLTPADICVMPQAKLERAIFRVSNPKPDRPDEAIAWRNLALRDESGAIKPDGIELAHRHAAEMRAAAAQAPAAGISREQWKWLGPGNIGGRVRALVIHPTSPERMWAGSVSGGIWYSADSGASWAPVNDFMGNLAVATLALDPTDADVMYAGTGEGFFNGDAVRGAGIFKSTDGGVSWSQLSSTANSSFYYVNRLAIAPDGATILAATRSALYRSTNGGSSWTSVLASDVLDVDFNPSNGSYAMAGGRGGLAWYSADNGVTWTQSGNLPTSGSTSHRVEVAYAPSVTSGAGTVYVSTNANSGEIWRSTDGGQTFTRQSTGVNYLGSQGWYDNVIWVSPTDADVVMVGGIDLFRSTNGGVDLVKVSTWWAAPGSAHADQHVIVAHPDYDGTTNRTVFFGNDGGVYRAADLNVLGTNQPTNTNGWQELNNNLGITQFYGAAGNAESGVIVGGTQDNGTLRYTGDSEAWNATYGGDGGFSAADPTDPDYFYGEYVYAQVHRTSDGGSTNSGEEIYGYGKSAPYVISDALNNQANFIAPFILDPNNPNRMLVGGLSLWRSNDVKAPNTVTTGPQWAAIKASMGQYISAIAVAPGNSDIIWVGHNNGNVYRTSNGTAASPTWTQVDTNSPSLPNRYVTRIAIDPGDSDIVYVTFGGFNADNVYRTTSAGASWSDRTGSGVTGLPDAPVRSLAISPANSSWIYVGTEVGVFASEDSGSTWKLPHDGPSNVSVDELFWMGNTLNAATHGRGLYQVLPRLSLSADSLSFGDQRINTPSAAQQITLTNISNADLRNIAVTAGGSFARTTTCGATLAPAASCTISVTFTPAAAGADNANLTIASNAYDAPASVALSGAGVGPGIQLSDPGLSFGTQRVGTTSAAQAVTLTNSGSDALIIISITASGNFARTTTCGATLAPAASCSISVTFTPTATGTRAGSLAVATDASGSPHSVVLAGEGVAPGAQLSAASVNFGEVALGSSAARQITLTNNGSATLSIVSITAGGDFTRTSTCGAALAPAASCTVSLTFAPSALGARAGSLTLTTDAPGGPRVVQLRGAGKQAMPRVNLPLLRR